MFANTPYFPGYNQSQPPNTSGMNASQTQVPDHTQLSLPTPTSLPANYNPQMQEFAKPKRKQVKNACVNCQKACKKCDEQRPCPRCVKYGLTETCVDSVRKERKKGIKRGPYKKRKQANGVSADGSPQPTNNMSVSTLANGIYTTANPTTTTADGRPATQTTTTANMGYANYPSANQFDSFPGFQGQSLQYLQQYGAMSLILQQAGNNVAASVANAVNNNNNNNNNANGENKTQEDGHNNGKPVDDDDGNKLSILSQLCTAVLDTVPNPAGTTNTTTTNTNTTTTSTTTNNNNNTTSSELKETKQENSTNSTPSQNSNHSHESTETEEKKVKAEPDAGISKGEKTDNK